MGLDMYLKASRYISAWKHTPDAEKSLAASIASLCGITPTPDSPSLTVSVNVGYWRKANAIHAWFIANCADGNDDCRSTEVTREQLTDLRDLCQKVLDTARLVPGQICVGTTYDDASPQGRKDYEPGNIIANADEVAALLPTTKGFFFGSTDYTAYYLDDIRDTISILDAALALPDCWDFEYCASW